MCILVIHVYIRNILLIHAMKVKCQLLSHVCLFVTPWIVLNFPGASDGKASAYNEGSPGLIPVSGRSPGEVNGNPLQYSCLENPTDKRAW